MKWVEIVAPPVARWWIKNRIGRRLFPKWFAKRDARQPLDETAEDFNQEDSEVNKDAIVGAFKSKLVWLGIVQVGYSLFETWANGGLNAEAVSTAISGVLTIVFRAVTTTSLAEKA